MSTTPGRTSRRTPGVVLLSPTLVDPFLARQQSGKKAAAASGSTKPPNLFAVTTPDPYAFTGDRKQQQPVNQSPIQVIRVGGGSVKKTPAKAKPAAAAAATPPPKPRSASAASARAQKAADEVTTALKPRSAAVASARAQKAADAEAAAELMRNQALSLLAATNGRDRTAPASTKRAASATPKSTARKRRRSADSESEAASSSEESSDEDMEPVKKPATAKAPLKPRSLTASLLSPKKKARTQAPPPSSSSKKKAASSSAAKPKGKRRTILDEVPAEAPKDDVCTVCHDGGNLMVCDLCVHAFHESCIEAHHPDNYETLKELGDDDPLVCANVHMTCTQRKKPMSMADVMPVISAKAADDVRVKWGARVSVGRGKRFYKSFTRHGDTYAVGAYITLKSEDSFLRNGKPLDFVAQIESMWEDAQGLQMVECRWMYLPEETKLGKMAHHQDAEVFATAHMDDCEISTISDLCDVVEYEEYVARMADKAAQEINPDNEYTRMLLFVRQTYDNDRDEFRPYIPLKGKVARSTKSSLAAASLSASPQKSRAQKGAPAASIYSQACAQLQLSAAPPRLPCREKEHASILRFVEQAIKRGSADGGLYVAGVPGTGKTATVVRVISELAARADMPNFEYVEINGMKLPEPHQLYTALWKALTGKHATPAKAAVYLDQRFRTTNARRPVCVLLVDELDYIMTRQQNVIYNLFDWPGRRAARLVVIGISNTIDLPDLLMPRVHSRLGLTKLHFEPYTTEQINQIIRDRLKELPAFHEDAIELCARKISSVSGDIRRALQICRRAAEICEEDQLRAAVAKKKNIKIALFASTSSAAASTVAASASSSAAASSAASTIAAASSDHSIGPQHIMRAIADLQNSNFIQHLSHAGTAHDKVLLCGLLTSIKYAASAGVAGGDTNPPIPLLDLVGHTERNMDARGVRGILAGLAGVRADQYPRFTVQDWHDVVQQWANLQLVQLVYTRGDRWPHVQLNLLTEDIDHAFRADELWDRLRA